MSLQKIENIELQKYLKTLKECSKNDSGKPVTDLRNNAYAFDDLSTLEGEKYRRKKKLRSADGLYVDKNGQNYLFEFKNCRKSHVPWKNVQEKAHDSLLT